MHRTSQQLPGNVFETSWKTATVSLPFFYVYPLTQPFLNFSSFFPPIPLLTAKILNKPEIIGIAIWSNKTCIIFFTVFLAVLSDLWCFHTFEIFGYNIITRNKWRPDQRYQRGKENSKMYKKKFKFEFSKLKYFNKMFGRKLAENFCQAKNCLAKTKKWKKKKKSKQAVNYFNHHCNQNKQPNNFI